MVIWCEKTVWSVTFTTLCTVTVPQLRSLPDLAILCTPKGHQTTDVIKWIRIYISLSVTIFSEIFNIDIQTLKRPALILQSIAFSPRAKRGGYWKISQEGFFFPPPLSDENEFGILLLAGWLMIAIKTVYSLVTLKTPYRGRCRHEELARRIDVVRRSEPRGQICR